MQARFSRHPPWALGRLRMACFYALSQIFPIQDRFTTLHLQRPTGDKSHWLGLCAHMQNTAATVTTPCNWACLVHPGHTAVAPAPGATPTARTGATLETSSGNARGLHCSQPEGRGAKNERCHAPCPDRGLAEGRAKRLASGLVSSPSASWRGMSCRLDAWAWKHTAFALPLPLSHLPGRAATGCPSRDSMARSTLPN